MDKRRTRISCFKAGEPLGNAPVIHRAPRTPEKAEQVFALLCHKIGDKFDRVVMHRGNLRRNSYVILKDARERTESPAKPARYKATSEQNKLARDGTAFASFTALLDAKGGYFPSLKVSKPDLARLADEYDTAQARRGDNRRVHRYQ